MNATPPAPSARHRDNELPSMTADGIVRGVTNRFGGMPPGLSHDPPQRTDSVVVIGLGRFGSAVAQSLMELGHEVLGMDENAHRVQLGADRLTHVVQADSTNTETLRQLGVANFAHIVVVVVVGIGIGIGIDLEASVLTVLALQELAIKDIWAKAMSAKHGQLLARTGTHHVVYPESASTSGLQLDSTELGPFIRTW